MRFFWAIEMSLLITGATGHLGPHLLAELRTSPFERLFVVARRDSRSAESRVRSIERAARQMLDARSIDACRPATVVPIDADWIADQARGIHRITGDVTVIIHAAADTRLTAPYDALARVNVQSTRDVCRLAAACPRLEQFLFVSTACVAGRRTGSIPERMHDDSAGFANAYERTKWEAERIVANSQLPARIARLATCAGSHETGYVNRLGALHHLLRWMSRGLVPMIPGTESTPVDVISTDIAARWLTRAAVQPPEGLQVCHVALGRSAVPLGELLDTLIAELNTDRRRPVQRPLLVDQEAFTAFSDMVRLSGDALFARVQASAASVLPSLLYPKIYETENAERCWNGPLPHSPWHVLLRQVISFCRSRHWDTTREISHA